MEIITTVVVAFAFLALFLIIAGACAFVVYGVLNWKKNQAGIDTAELQILRGLFADEAKATKEAELKAKLNRVAAPPKPVVVRPTPTPTI